MTRLGIKKHWMLIAAFALAMPGGLASSGCGGDEPQAAPPRPQGKKRGKKARGKRGGGGGKGARISAYKKVPDEYRRKFTEDDFVPDVTGDENRDPYRSYVINMGRPRSTDIETNEVCTEENSVAANVPTRDLNLIGIVLRGTSSYALFRDRQSYGHIVRRGDCLGREKAQVETIGAGFVRLEYIPEAPPGAPAPAAQQRDIQLHPREIQIDEQINIDEQQPANQAEE